MFKNATILALQRLLFFSYLLRFVIFKNIINILISYKYLLDTVIIKTLLICIIILFFCFFKIVKAETFSEKGAIGFGSLIAISLLCEKDKYLKSGQAVKLRTGYQKSVSKELHKSFIIGYNKGLKEKKIFSRNYNKWVKFNINKKDCAQIQNALTNYSKLLFPLDVYTVKGDVLLEYYDSKKSKWIAVSNYFGSIYKDPSIALNLCKLHLSTFDNLNYEYRCNPVD